jgi:hypothetical protein
MIGRVVGFLFGVAIAATGFGIWRPAAFAKYVDFSRIELGDFGQYKAIICWLIMAVGAAVAVAALQRPSSRPAKRKAALSLGETEPEPEEAHAPPPFAFQEEAHHDGHAHDDHHDGGHHDAHRADADEAADDHEAHQGDHHHTTAHAH